MGCGVLLVFPLGHSEVSPFDLVMRLTPQDRAGMPDNDFVFPKERKYPIKTRKLALAALMLVGMHGTDAEKQAVRVAVKQRYPDLCKSKCL